MPALTLFHLQQQHGVAIDTRLSAYYNGWPQRANGPEGHEPQALNLSARWLGAMSDDQLRAWAKQHQLQSDTPIALYGSRGFRGEGRRKNYYDHPKEDAIIMTKEFGAAEAEAQQ